MSRFALRAAALLAVAGLALAACGNDKGAAPGLRAVKGVAGDLLKRGKDKAPPTPLTRAQLAGFNTPMLMAEVKTANVLLYLVRLGDVLDIDLAEAARRKIAINAGRYPAEQVRGRAVKYDRL